MILRIPCGKSCQLPDGGGSIGSELVGSHWKVVMARSHTHTAHTPCAHTPLAHMQRKLFGHLQ